MDGHVDIELGPGLEMCWAEDLCPSNLAPFCHGQWLEFEPLDLLCPLQMVFANQLDFVPIDHIQPLQMILADELEFVPLDPLHSLQMVFANQLEFVPMDHIPPLQMILADEPKRKFAPVVDWQCLQLFLVPFHQSSTEVHLACVVSWLEDLQGRFCETNLEQQDNKYEKTQVLCYSSLWEARLLRIILGFDVPEEVGCGPGSKSLTLCWVSAAWASVVSSLRSMSKWVGPGLAVELCLEHGKYTSLESVS